MINDQILSRIYSSSPQRFWPGSCHENLRQGYVFFFSKVDSQISGRGFDSHECTIKILNKSEHLNKSEQKKPFPCYGGIPIPWKSK